MLKQELNLLDVFSISTGAMLSGLFILPGLAYAICGPSLLISYILAGLLALTGLFSQAELVSAMPKTGGTYFYVARSMGTAVGTVYGLITWLSLALKSAMELVAVGVFTISILHMDVRIIAALFCLLFLAINYIGIKEAGRIQTIFVFLILAAMIYYVVQGGFHINIEYLKPFAPAGIPGILTASGFIFVSFGGLLKVASIAEEVREPGRTIPKAMIISLITVSLLYLSVIFVTMGAVEPETLRHNLTPISAAADVVPQTGGELIYGLVALLAIFSAANAGIMASSRYPLALSRDGLLPVFLSAVNVRFKTPHYSILITGLIIVAAIFFFPLSIIIKAASCVLILTYLFACLSVVILRESRIQNYQPQFRSPLYPWVQIAGSIGFIGLLVEIGRETLLTTSFLLVGGLFTYWFYGRIKTTREYALLHLVERITARELTSHSLETELKEIIRERDDILKDRFDHEVEECTVLDLGSPLDAATFFELAAKKLSGRLGMDTESLLRLFLQREKESSTVITPYLAVPHIVIEGEHKFCLLMARSVEGIHFSSAAPKVHSVFVLVGTRDERPFHLRSLAAIAQIVQDTSFERKWLGAKNAETLRDLILLGKRRR